MKQKLAITTFIFVLCCFYNNITAQVLKVTGTVTQSPSNKPLQGATVIVKSTATTAITDNDGNYSINIPANGGTILVTYLGMNSQEKKVKASGVVNFSLQENSAKSDLDEVVVIGYGTQKVTKVSGAISTVKAADIAKSQAVRVEEAIQGRASGVTVIQSGSPGAKPTFLIRGIPSYNGSQPLVIVDGSQQTLDDLNSINPNDIESINVLKDASATAIYGVGGGNGVVVVTTKSGKKNQKTQFTLSSSYGMQQVQNTIGVLNATEYAAMLNEGSTTSGGGLIFNDLSKVGVGTNWQNEVFKNAPIQSHTISVNGGSDKISYFLSAGITDQAGILGGADKSKFQRSNFTANLNFQLTPKLKFITNATQVLLNTRGVKEGTWNGIIGEALNYDPTVPVYNNVANTVGEFGFSTLLKGEVHNPLTEMANTYNKNDGNKIYGKFELQYDVLKNLKVTARLGYTNYIDNSKSFAPLVFYGLKNKDNSMDEFGEAIKDTTASGVIVPRHNSVSTSRNNYFNYNPELFANYDFKLKDKHHFETTLGFRLGKNSGNAVGASKQDVPFNSWQYASLQAATGINTSNNVLANTGYAYQYFSKAVSYFGRANYDYENKYLASLTVRRDGSSEFVDAKKYGTFYSGSLGWVVSKEKFFNVDAINFLKLRGSYGQVGSSNGARLQTSSIITGGTYNNIGNNNGYYFGGVFFPGSTIGSQINPELLGWETNIQFNGGFEISILKNKISLTADYFSRKVKNLIFTGNQSLFIGTVPAPESNIGSTKSSGVDLLLTYNESLFKKVKLNTSLSFTTSTNLVTATNADGSAKIPGGYYFNGQGQTVTVFEKGFAPGYFYGYKTDGLFQTTNDVKNAAKQPGAQAGDIRYVDVNGDGVIDSKDQTQIGNPFPKFVMGWNLGLEYKNFDFTAFTYVSYGNDIYRAYERNANYTNKFRSILGRWTGPNSTNDAANPRYTFTDVNNNARVSDRYVEDGSFIKIKNIQLGYTLPSNIAKGVFNKIRFYGAVKNAFTFTKYSGFDPEISGGILGSGVDLGTYPQARTFMVGLDLKF
jgi:TonB-dependent starch-binding outer membrane protein SusC